MMVTILEQLRRILHGALAGALGGGMIGAALATIAASIEPWTDEAGPWLATTGLAALLALVIGAWSGARSGILTSIIIAVLENHRLTVLLVAPLIGFTSGLAHGLLASRSKLPSIHLEQPHGIVGNNPFLCGRSAGGGLFHPLVDEPQQ